ncbi:MAG: DNA polymerase III subunit gamma/tau [Planctomycetaceae bacterium]|nr:DNA polymerase III subunit gamma/tau [Planctomycetaceae bacterium]
MSSGSHYTVLARRFRPQAFDDVVGQEHVAQALRNAIRANRVAHAYLFTGARGVGKTSTARILAKALNCPHVKDGVPCNQCDVCEAVSAGDDVDVLEIDGASNRGIEDIRSLRANVRSMSMGGRFKLYIIDEVHMLTREAFNALLKTLEEPPAMVKFVFCTTEPNKVPDTILSRCQRFDFSAIGEESIGQRLREIAAAEGFEVEDDAIELVARRARGSMRDSQSLFDQLLAFSDGVVRAADVHRMLGTASDELLCSLFDAVSQHRPGEVLNLLESALNSGVQAGEMLDQCISYVRDMMVTLSGGATVALASVAGSLRPAVTEQATRLTLPNIMAGFQILSEAKGRMLRSTFARVLLEMALVQVALLEDLSAISGLLSGNLPALPAGAAAPAVTDTASAGDDEKKNDIEPATEEPNPPEDVTPAGPAFEFSPENQARLLAEVIDKAAFTLSTALKSVSAIAISGPNGLEIQVGDSYDFQRRVIEQHENRSAIQSIVERLTGIDPVITVKTVVSPAGEKPVTGPATAPAEASPRPVAAERRQDPPRVKGPARLRERKDVDPEQDAFVQQVVATFEARVVRVTDAPVRRGTVPENSEES